MDSRNSLIEAFIRGATLHAASLIPASTPLAVLEGMLRDKFVSEAKDGRTVIGITEGGGSTQFAVPDGLSPADVFSLVNEAIKIVSAMPDPSNPTQPRRVARLRFVCNLSTIR